MALECRRWAGRLCSGEMHSSLTDALAFGTTEVQLECFGRACAHVVLSETLQRVPCRGVHSWNMFSDLNPSLSWIQTSVFVMHPSLSWIQTSVSVMLEVANASCSDRTILLPSILDMLEAAAQHLSRRNQN